MTAWLDADWPAPAGVRALSTTRYGLGVSQPPFDHLNLGSRCGDDADAVKANRAVLAEALGLPAAPRWLRQVHGVDVVVDPGLDEPEADASVTSQSGKVLAILTADCLPVVFAARDGSEVAVAHAGWRGLAAGVLEATVAAMRSSADQLMAWLGPAAGPDAYEISEEVRDAFVAYAPSAETAFLSTRAGHWNVDLFRLARMRLVDAGMDDAHVHGGGLCTISDPARFFSHRRDQRSGRIATLVWRDAE